MHNTEYLGPESSISKEIDEMKYRQKDESFDEKIKRISRTLSDDDEHRYKLEDILGNMRFLPAGRVQAAIGSNRITTAYNCFVSGVIEDNMNSIMEKASEAAETMRRGGGIGYDFSRIRPRGDKIKSLDSQASGPVSFMGIFDAVCQTIASSGHRRGAQMGVLRVDHPDIEEFIMAKRNSDKLTGFNISVGITDKFMEALTNDLDSSFTLEFQGKPYRTICARDLWDKIMDSTWDWAEPGVLFIDRIGEMNNLYYCEDIFATNPCGEQPLPPYGACLLGSFNLTKYLDEEQIAGGEVAESHFEFDFKRFKSDIYEVVRAMDNVIDRTIYPLKKQADEAKDKRRMGLGVTGLANAGELLGKPYASEDSVKKLIREHGIRNSHLTSIAPTGTISLVADNVSGGIEPVFSHYYDRTIQTFEGPKTERVKDYAYNKGIEGRGANDINVNEHLAVLLLAQNYIDSACSKTCNVGDEVTYEDFKQVYVDAWKGGAKGCTTFRLSGKRFGVLQTVEEKEKNTNAPETVEEEEQVEACFIDPQTGQKECA
jgi:ribonucleoside-diphosphate reductase alpha chain